MRQKLRVCRHRTPRTRIQSMTPTYHNATRGVHCAAGTRSVEDARHPTTGRAWTNIDADESAARSLLAWTPGLVVHDIRMLLQELIVRSGHNRGRAKPSDHSPRKSQCLMRRNCCNTIFIGPSRRPHRVLNSQPKKHYFHNEEATTTGFDAAMVLPAR